MPQVFSSERLADLLIDPRENLNFEIKNWLDLSNDNDAKAILAKAAIALANHGGGFIALGLVENDAGVDEAQVLRRSSSRPPSPESPPRPC
jgi:predicted HTH transcriptional regulator